ncbi:MAG: HAD-IIIC family phosphatase [Ruminococcus sp.]|nr:HAD-IIIC family phosphatase [Ruminococcus sp.]
MKELEYPFDSREILQKRRRIRRTLLADGTPRIPKRIAVLSGSTTSDLVEILELFLLNEGIVPTFYQSEYAQYWQDAMFDAPALVEFQPELIWIHTTSRNITEAPLPLSASLEEIEAALDRQTAHFTQMWAHLSARYHCPIIQNNMELPAWRLLGNRDAWDPHGMVWFVEELNRRFAAYAQEHTDFYLHDIHYLSACYGLDQWHDATYWYLYKYALCLPAIPEFAYSLTRIIRSIYGKNKKVLALDLDNTLWGGVIGDDGPEGIAIGQETAEAQAYTEVQAYCKAQKQLGVLLTICSKNDPENVTFGLSHPDSVLRESDFVSIAASWSPKDQELRQTAQTLSLLPESFVFIDDNPAEREIVSAQIPGIAVPAFDSPAACIRVLDRAGYFEATTLSVADANRTAMYHASAQRAQLQQTYANYTEYLLGLEMYAEIRDFTPMALPRIVQLTNKSNQFNLTTRRYTQSEMEQVARDPNRICLCGRLRDRFGDNGIVSVVIGEIAGDTLHVELWLMSCRVLKRDMELAMLDVLVAACKARGVQKIRGYYLHTAKNAMVRDLYGDFGFTKEKSFENSDTTWLLDLDGYSEKNHVIRVNQEEHIHDT